jgi:hypothetical protein
VQTFLLGLVKIVAEYADRDDQGADDEIQKYCGCRASFSPKSAKSEREVYWDACDSESDNRKSDAMNASDTRRKILDAIGRRFRRTTPSGAEPLLRRQRRGDARLQRICRSGHAAKIDQGHRPAHRRMVRGASIEAFEANTDAILRSRAPRGVSMDGPQQGSSSLRSHLRMTGPATAPRRSHQAHR